MANKNLKCMVCGIHYSIYSMHECSAKNKEWKSKSGGLEQACFGDCDLDRELTKKETACVFLAPTLLFCNKLGWPFCCLCL